MRFIILRQRRGFTLVELLVVCSIIAIITAMAIPVILGIKVSANRAKCASNMRQIGTALLLYAGDNNNMLPPTTHTTGALGKAGRYQSWIFVLAPYLSDLDEVRICPADNKERQQKIREQEGLTSYVLNDIIFDSENEGGGYNNLQMIPHPARTMIMFNVSDDRPINRGWDHAHCGTWTSWYAVCADIEPDRHRYGERAKDRLKGSANYLFMDGHVENISAKELKSRVAAGENPANVPLD